MKWPQVPRFGRSEWLFSLKSFAAAMLAMYLAARAGLPRPFWALMTTYVVAHPLAGAVRSKAIYRFCGTLLGSAAAVLLVPTLSNAPELLTLALALWVAGCLFVSLLDRTPRAYLFMLAGYTAALIGFPSVQTPEVMFASAVARVEEIGLGILCATLVHSLVLPVGLAPTVLGLLDRTLRDARNWAADLMRLEFASETRDARTLAADRRRLAADMTQLRLLSTHVPFDTTHLRWTAGALRTMQDRIAAMTPALSAVDDRLNALLTAYGHVPRDIADGLARTRAWLERQRAAVGPGRHEETQFEALLTDIRALGEAPDADDWRRALRIGLACRLEELLHGWRTCMRLRTDIDATLHGGVVPGRTAALGNRVLHRDYGMALLSGLAAMVAIALCCAFWILTGWPSGSGAAMMAAVFCCFFAGMDDPVPLIQGFLKYTLWSVPLSAVYVLVLFPLVQDVGMLALICAPTFIVLGLFVARPATTGSGMAMLFGVAGTLALYDTANADLPGFINSTLAQVIGIVAAAWVTRLMRSVGGAWSARRIQRAIWRELGVLATMRNPGHDQAYAVRMIDRIGLLAPRVAQAGGTIEGVLADDVLRDLRVGADIVALQQMRGQAHAASCGALLDDIAALFNARGAGHTAAPPPALLGRIDAALQASLASLGQAPTHAARSALASLVGLRRNLFPQAAPTLGSPLEAHA
ncbi:MAG: FUSC family protein [Rhodocyclaceae bacterium]